MHQKFCKKIFFLLHCFVVPLHSFPTTFSGTALGGCKEKKPNQPLKTKRQTLKLHFSVFQSSFPRQKISQPAEESRGCFINRGSLRAKHCVRSVSAPPPLSLPHSLLQQAKHSHSHDSIRSRRHDHFPLSQRRLAPQKKKRQKTKKTLPLFKVV